jgi:hypothetical protein
MYFAKQEFKKLNGFWTDITDYKPITRQAFKGNFPVLVKGNNWNISENGKKLSFSGGI